MDSLNIYKQGSQVSSSLFQHFHNCHELILVEKGTATFNIENAVYPAKEHSLVIIGNLEKHKLSMNSNPYIRRVMLIPNEFLNNLIRMPQLVSIFLYRPKGFEHIIELDDKLYNNLEYYFDEMIFEFNNTFSLKNERIENLIELMLIELYRNKKDHFSWENREDMNVVFQAQRHLYQNFNQQISLESTAELLRVSKYHLSHKFKEISGYGFHQYLVFCRINEAKRLLETTDLPITIVCEKCGYLDINNFIRAFKEREGITPLQFRKRKKN